MDLVPRTPRRVRKLPGTAAAGIAVPQVPAPVAPKPPSLVNQQLPSAAAQDTAAAVAVKQPAPAKAAGAVDPVTGVRTPPPNGGSNTVTDAGITTPQQDAAAAQPDPVDAPVADAEGDAVGNGFAEDDDIYGARNEQINDHIDRLLSGEGDTAEREALIRDESAAALGADRANASARMGAGGWGMSGAMAALDGDIRSSNSLAMADRILDDRSSEDQRFKDNALAGIGAEVDMRDWASADALDRMKLETLQKLLAGEGDGVVEEGGDLAEEVAGGALDLVDEGLGVERETAELPSAGGGDAGMSSRTPIIVTSPPPGAKLINSNASFGGALYQGTDGKYYGIKGA